MDVRRSFYVYDICVVHLRLTAPRYKAIDIMYSLNGTQFGRVLLALAILALAMFARIAGADEVKQAVKPAAKSAPQDVAVGFYPYTIYALSQQDNIFSADFYMWMRWKGELDPTATVEFVNNVERSEFVSNRVFEKPVVFDDGQSLQQMRVQGKFSQPLSLHNYPLDKHELNIALQDNTFPIDELIYREDVGQSNLASKIVLPGWKITGWKITSEPQTFSTDFGDIRKKERAAYSTIRFTLSIERTLSFFVWKLMLPLAIVLLLGCSALFIHPEYSDTRLGAPTTALLSLVFLQQSYSSTLPEIGYLVLLDKIYVLAYVVVLVLMISTIITSAKVRQGGDENIAQAIRQDRFVVCGMFLAFVVGGAFLLLNQT